MPMLTFAGSQDDVIMDVIRDGDVVQGLSSDISGAADGREDEAVHGNGRENSEPGVTTSTSRAQQTAAHVRQEHARTARAAAGHSSLMSIFTRYRKIRQFKGGVMGTVYKAQDLASKGLYREVGAKTLLASCDTSLFQ